MFIPAGGPQGQTSAAISFPIPLNEENKTEYLNEKKVAESGLRPNCPGSALKPEAVAGFLCVFQGAIAVDGSLESEWQNAEFNSIANLAGEQGVGGKVGDLVIYRTTEYVEGAPTHAIAKLASINAAGSWAVKEKK